MATLQYVEIPSSATRLESSEPSEDIRPAPKIVTNLPHPENAVGHLTTSTAQPHSPTGTKNASSGFNFQQILLSSALPIPANAPSSPRAPAGKGAPKLLTTRDSLSIPITTVNFRRFVSKMGPYFWGMDRAEEIILWKKGWQHTTVWMAVYAFFCMFLSVDHALCVVLTVRLGYFPRLVLLLPLVILLCVIMATDPYLKQPEVTVVEVHSPGASLPSPTPSQPSEGSVDWLANLQAIQNLMGSLFVF